MHWDMAEVANKVAEIKYDLADRITEEQNKKHPEQQIPISAELKEQRIQLIDMYRELLVDDLDIALQKISRWGEETGAYCADLGLTIDAALDELPSYRLVMAEVIAEEAEKYGATFRDYHQAMSKLHRIIDQAAQSFSEAFVRHHNQMMEKAQAALTELSVPVVPLSEGVAVLPVIGTIDTERAKLLMEESLRRSAALGVSYFILDLSGVPVVDTAVAQQLLQVIQALRLVGVRAVISGIRVEIAQTIISLGIDFQYIKTYSTLQHALSAYMEK
jgi:rsbT co-antagonist protein RsbR